MRKFREMAVLSDNPSDQHSWSVLWHEQPDKNHIICKPPDYFENPFSEATKGALMRERLVEYSAGFCIKVPNAVLYGERAVVTPDNTLLADVCSYPPGRNHFSAGARQFERMEPTTESDGWLSSMRVDDPEVEVAEEACLLSSWEHWNYGAILLRQMPKLITLRNLGLSDISVVSPVSKWHEDILKVFGIKKWIPHDRAKSYRFRSLIVTSQRTHAFAFDKPVRDFFENLAKAVSKETEIIEAAPLLYVSRITQGKLRPNYRRCINEEELAAALENIGFQIYEPESHSVSKQIATFHSARFVVGPSGAGMFNTIFCKPGTNVLSIEPLPNWTWQHCNMFASMDHSFGFVAGGVNESDAEPVQKSWTADISTIMQRVLGVLAKL